MIADALAALEALGPVAALRGSVWVYPLVNVGHVLGIALLVGAIVPLDLRLLGFFKGVSAAALWPVLTRCAGVGLGLALVTGVMLFATRAAEYAASGLFIAKLIIVAVGALNVIAVHYAESKQHSAMRQGADSPMQGYVRFGAGVSLAAWPAALVFGRLVGYF